MACFRSAAALRLLLVLLLLPWAARAQTPTIGAVAPASGLAGTFVTITGTNLGLVTGVRFGTGALTADFVSQSATSLTVRVPVVASTGPLTLTTSAGASASSATPFTYSPRLSLVAALSPAGPLDGCQLQTLTASVTSPAFAGGTGPNSDVNSVAVQTDGKVLAGGLFTSYNGTTANRLVRLNPDGSRDASFATGAGFDDAVNSVVVLADGKVLAGGLFSSYNGTTANRLVRLNADGSRDAGFATGTGFPRDVNSVVVQADGKVLVGGFFPSYNGTPATCLVRLNANGSLDASFGTGTGFVGTVNSVAVQADGKVLVGGQFISYNGTAVNCLVRLNANGSLDAGFATGAGFGGNPVNSVAVQADGKVLVGGYFPSYNGTTVGNFVRLNADGSRDASFTTGAGFNTPVKSVAVQADGKVLVGGTFSTYNGTGGKCLVRLNPDGSRDAGFAANPDFATGSFFVSSVNSVAVQADGKVLAGGFFFVSSQSCLARFNANGGLNNAATAVSGATFTFSPRSSTTNPLVTNIAGSYSVTASLNGETSGASNTVVLTACSSSISAFTPASGPAGTLVTITGTNLGLVTGVRFGTGALATDFVSQSATSLTVRVPVVASTGPLTLTTNAGASASSATPFTYTPRPAGLVATLTPTGPLDVCQPRTLTATAASPAFGSGTGFSGTVKAVAVQADGRVLVGGSFGTYNGVAANRLVRLNPDGSRDATFGTGTGFGSDVNAIAVQADGKVLVGGDFLAYNGVAASNLVRLNADGTRDATFVVGTGFGGTVRSVVLQANGQVLVGGGFIAYNGTAARCLVRLNANGSVDTGFNTATGADNLVQAIAVQADGKVVIGGDFTSYNTTPANRLARLNFDGTRDAGFGVSINNTVNALAVQADSKVLVGGYFTSFTGNSLVRLDPTGALDGTFVTGTGFTLGSNVGIVRTLMVQADGQVLVGGQFDGYNGPVVANLVRLGPTGTADTTFGTGTGPNSVVLATAVQADGMALVGGDFITYQGATANRLARLTTGGRLNTAPTAVGGAAFTFAPGTTTANPLVTSTAGSYTATARLNGEVSPASNTVVLTACLTPTRTTAEVAAVRLFPNPAGHGRAPGGAATLTGAQPGAVVTVYDALGRPVATATADAAGTAALALPAELAAGVYVVRAGSAALRLVVE